MIGVARHSLSPWMMALTGGMARPDAPTFTAEPGTVIGQVVLDVTALPASWGDAVEPGDGAGTLGKLQWWNAVDGWQDLIEPAATGEYTVTMPEGMWGLTVEVRVRGVNAEGIVGRFASDMVEVPGWDLFFWNMTIGDENVVIGEENIVMEIA